MRVQGIDTSNSRQIEKSDHLAPAKLSSEKSFARTVTDLTSDAYTRHVEDAIEQIALQGEKLRSKADMTEFKKYKDMVRSLMDETVSNSYSFSKSMRFDGRGRSKTFALIKRVNQNIESMTEELLKSEVDNLSLMESMDEIKGLLVDIFL